MAPPFVAAPRVGQSGRRIDLFCSARRGRKAQGERERIRDETGMDISRLSVCPEGLKN